MLNCNHSFGYLKRLATDPDNLIIFTSKPIGNSIAKQIVDGKKIFSNETEQIEIKCRIESIYSLNSHSDFNQLNAYISRLRPKLKRIIVNHGERAKVQNFSSYSSKVHNISTQYMQNQEAMRLL
jgi:predicted metal-dependent RNase